MAGISSKTRVIGLRLPNDLVEIALRRSQGNYTTISDYLRQRLIYDLTRKHRKFRDDLPNFTQRLDK